MCGVTKGGVMATDDGGAVEFWPEHGVGPLWVGGRPADLVVLGLPGPLVRRLGEFAAAYREDRLPVDGPGDAGYLAQGAALLREVRSALPGREVVVSEPWWERDGPAG